MITEAQEANLSAAMTRGRQDKKTPFCIHVVDGRLMPNVPEILAHKDYRPYRGNPKASIDERMAFLRSGGMGGTKREVIMPDPEDMPEPEKPFEIGKASRDELVAFAFSEYQEVLDPTMHLTTLRATIAKLAKQHAPLDLG